MLLAYQYQILIYISSRGTASAMTKTAASAAFDFETVVDADNCGTDLRGELYAKSNPCGDYPVLSINDFMW